MTSARMTSISFVILLLGYAVVHFLLYSSTENKQIREYILSVPFVLEEIGEDARIGKAFSFYVKGGSGKRKEKTGLYIFPVNGSRSSGEVKVRVTYHGTPFTINSLHLFLADRCFVKRGKSEKSCEPKRFKRWQRGERWLGVQG